MRKKRPPDQINIPKLYHPPTPPRFNVDVAHCTTDAKTGVFVRTTAMFSRNPTLNLGGVGGIKSNKSIRGMQAFISHQPDKLMEEGVADLLDSDHV